MGGGGGRMGVGVASSSRNGGDRAKRETSLRRVSDNSNVLGGIRSAIGYMMPKSIVW